MSTGAGVVSPFGGMSLTELRRRASAERVERVAENAQRDAPALKLAGPTPTVTLAEPARSTVEVSFEDLMFTMEDASSKADAWADEMSGLSTADEAERVDSPRRSKARIAFLVTVTILVTLLAGMAVLLGLLWTTPTMSVPPEWLPKQLWLPPWHLSSSR